MERIVTYRKGQIVRIGYILLENPDAVLSAAHELTSVNGLFSFDVNSSLVETRWWLDEFEVLVDSAFTGGKQA
jgi:hypothetical protein